MAARVLLVLTFPFLVSCENMRTEATAIQRCIRGFAHFVRILQRFEAEKLDPTGRSRLRNELNECKTYLAEGHVGFEALSEETGKRYWLSRAAIKAYDRATELGEELRD